MPTVYLVQEPLKRDRLTRTVVPRFDLRRLEPYGQAVCLMKWSELEEYNAGRGMDTEALLRQFREKLATFSDADYLVPVGSPVLIAMAALVAADMNDGRVRMLDWVRNDEEYRSIDIDMEWLPLA